MACRDPPPFYRGRAGRSIRLVHCAWRPRAFLETSPKYLSGSGLLASPTLSPAVRAVSRRESPFWVPEAGAPAIFLADMPFSSFQRRASRWLRWGARIIEACGGYTTRLLYNSVAGSAPYWPPMWDMVPEIRRITYVSGDMRPASGSASSNGTPIADAPENPGQAPVGPLSATGSRIDVWARRNVRDLRYRRTTPIT